MVSPDWESESELVGVHHASVVPLRIGRQIHANYSMISILDSLSLKGQRDSRAALKHVETVVADVNECKLRIVHN